MDKLYSRADFGITKYEGTLRNGLKTVFLEKPFSPIRAHIMMRAGSIFDPTDRTGLAHFTEHMLFTGSHRCNRDNFWGIISGVGGYFNGSTAKEWMRVQCEVALKEHLPKMGEYFTYLLSEILTDTHSIEKEKRVIISEIERAESNRSRKHGKRIDTVLSNNSIWGRDELGSIESVQQISPQDVATFFETYCCVENMVLVVAGGCSWNDVVQTFENIPLLHGKRHELPPAPESLLTSSLVWCEEDQPETGILIGFNGPSWESRNDHLLSFALTFAHDGFTSRFYKKLRNELGLAYSVSFASQSFKSVSYLGTATGVPRQKLHQAVDSIEQCYREFVEVGMTPEEIENKRQTMWYSTLRNVTSSENWVNRYDYYTLFRERFTEVGEFPDVHNYRRTFTSEEISDVLKRYIQLETSHRIFYGKKPD